MLKADNISSYYGNIQALRGVDVKVNSGEIVALIGSNGAGKSTLLMTISGVNKTASGQIIFNEKNIETFFDTFRIYKWRSVVQSGRMHGLGPCGYRFKSCHSDHTPS